MSSGTVQGLAVEVPDTPRGLFPPTQRGRSRRLIGDLVVDLGFARRETVERAVATAREQGLTTGQVLLEAGEVRQDQLARALAERFGVDFVDLSLYEIDMGAVALVPADVAKRYSAVPVGFMPDGSLLLAMSDPTNVQTVDEVSMITGRKVRSAAASPDDIGALINRLGQLDEVPELEDPELETELTLDPISADVAPIVKLVHSVIARAVDQGASDIHFNPEQGEMQIQFRIDGVLAPAASVARSMVGGVISRVKILAGLDIAERRVPQDGRMTMNVEGRRVDMRVVTLPLVRGEGLVMRILDAGAVVRDLGSLGMQEQALERFVSALKRPYGSVLVTGPTGSGKSTTLYGALAEINDGERSIITVEDPVESQIPGVKQMQVSTKTGVGFAAALRAILRADPDVIMVGEIRDRETAIIAVQAALTGHLVLSTLHTRDAASALTRLIDMGTEPFMVSAAIDCVVAQRLARALCEHCKRAAAIPDEVRASHSLGDLEVFEPVGCIRCANTGYRGRLGLFEVMPVGDEIRQALLERPRVNEIYEAAIAAGMRTMREDGLDKVRQGLTSLAEMSRVTSVL
jgi:type IV pilus assembly protein PilB